MSYFNAIFEQYDIQLSENFESYDKLNEEFSNNYRSFVERFRDYLNLNDFLFSLLIIISFLFIHILALVIQSGWEYYTVPFNDFTFFLCILIGTTTFIVLNAKRHLKKFTASLLTLTQDNFAVSSSKFKNILQQRYIDYKLLPYGIVFGIINMFFGHLFGIECLLPHESAYLVSTSIYLLFFAAGFVNGLAIGGILIVIKMTQSLNFKNEVKLNYFYPDKCAGTLIIGNILFIFSLYTIASGVLIFTYLHITPWSTLSTAPIQNLMLLWKLFPFFMAGIVFLYPVFLLNHHLIRYKYKEQLRVRKRLSYINELIMNLSSDDPLNKDQMELLDGHYIKLERIDQFIKQMNTWPYDLNSKTIFISVFLPVLIAAIAEGSEKIISSFLQQL